MNAWILLLGAFLFMNKGNTSSTDTDKKGPTGGKKGGSTTQLTVTWDGKTTNFDPVYFQTHKTLYGQYAKKVDGFRGPNIYASTSRDFYGEKSAVNALVRASQNWGGLTNFPLVVDAYRSVAEQNDAHRRKPTLAAPAGTSKHTRGLAFDLRAHPGPGYIMNGRDSSTWGNQDTMAEKLARYGFTRPDANEPWHFEYGG